MKPKYIAALVLLGLLYVIVSFRSIGEPLLGDSFYLPWYSQMLTDTHNAAFLHPPLYPALLRLITIVFGVSVENFRLAGMVCFFISLALIYAVAKNVSGGQAFYGALAVFFYCINPLAVKGSLLTDIDTTLLTPLMLLYILILHKYSERVTFKVNVLLGILFALMLTAKLTTPFMLAASVMIIAFIEKKGPGTLVSAAIPFFAGTLAFIAFWYAWSAVCGVSFLAPFDHLFDAFRGAKMVSQSGVNGLRALSRLCLWVSPSMLLLYFVCVFGLLKGFLSFAGKNGALSIVALLSIFIYAGYTVFGRVTHTFPKYQYPFVALVCVLLAALLSGLPSLEKPEKIFVTAAAALVCAFIYFGVGDILYITDYKIKAKMVSGAAGMRAVLFPALWKTFLYVLPLPAVFAALRAFFPGKQIYRSLILTLLICMVGANVSTDLLQFKADYLTVYCYGADFPESLSKYLKENITPGKKLLATEDISYFVSRDDFVPGGQWNDQDKLLNIARSEDVDYVVYGISSNTIYQYQKVFRGTDFSAYLKAHYTPVALGSYTIWRKEGRSFGQ